MNPEQFVDALSAKGIALNNSQIQQFERYYALLVEWNEKINLTAITEKNEVYLKHFYDSVMMLWELPLDHYDLTLVDVGAGAGFPSIPLKIIKPEIKLTIVDSLNKRINFLNLVVEELGLAQVNTVHGRAEEVGQNPSYREQFDLVTARAVAALNVLAELCIPLVKKGGHFIALKSAKTEEEIQSAKAAITLLGAKLEMVQTAILPMEESERTFIKIKKTLNTPKKYPRQPGKPTKQPIK